MSPGQHSSLSSGHALLYTRLIEVRDLAACEAFYDLVLVEALGFAKQHFERWALLHVQYKAPGLRLVLRQWASFEPRDSPDIGALGDFHTFTVRSDEDLRRVAACLAAAGVIVQLVPAYQDHMRIDLSDPDGRSLSIENIDLVDQDLGLLPDDWSVDCAASGSRTSSIP